MKINVMLKSLCLLFFVGIFSNNVLAKETVYITTGEFPPFTSQKFEHLGTSIRILNAVFELSEMDMEIEFFPFSRAFDLVKRGKKDATFPWFYNDSRAQDFYYTEAVFSESIHFFHLKSYSFDWQTMGDLEGIDIGALISFSFGKEFDEAVKAKKLWVQPAASDEINFRKLLKGRIKIFPVNVEVGQHLLRNKFTEAERELVTYHAKPVVVEPLYLLFSKKNPKNIERVKAFNQGLNRLKSTEKYKQYIKQVNQP